jgi:PhnB protein
MNLVQTYLYFDGRCEEALGFYRDRLGARITRLLRFKEAPPEDSHRQINAAMQDKVMHASFELGQTIIMASDQHHEGQKTTFSGFALSISVADAAEAQRVFSALADGGVVSMSIEKTFFSPAFGMVTDRFGVTWLVIASA